MTWIAEDTLFLILGLLSIGATAYGVYHLITFPYGDSLLQTMGAMRP